MLGVVRDTKAMTRRLGSLVKLHLELAKLESKKKAIALGVGIGLGGLALILVLYAIGFGFAAGAVGLTELLPLWASLLIVMGALLLGAGICGFLAMRFVKKGAPPLPSQAFEEMERTIRSIRNHG
jgi:Putative Actinobacterial Holin-X, holin superfamily III